MNEIEIHTGSKEWLDKHDIHRFSHEAMATIFEIYISHKDQGYASQAADEAFSKLDQLEQELSRFIENSDISRINSLTKNQSIVVGPDVFECLQACQTLYGDTNGAFDISSGPLIETWRHKDNLTDEELNLQIQRALKNMGTEKLEINPHRHEVTLLVDTVHLDLGGYGKGYALDRMAETLGEWSISIALLNGGRSSTYALAGPPGLEGWPLSIDNPLNPEEEIQKINLRFASLSGSGIQKGAHIIHPYTGYPVEGRLAAWACSRSAALSDALSTAFMIMPENAIHHYILDHPDISGLILEPEEQRGGQKQLVLGGFRDLA